MQNHMQKQKGRLTALLTLLAMHQNSNDTGEKITQVSNDNQQP